MATSMQYSGKQLDMIEVKRLLSILQIFFVCITSSLTMFAIKLAVCENYKW